MAKKGIVFEPSSFGDSLVASGDYAVWRNNLLHKWTGTHWEHISHFQAVDEAQAFIKSKYQVDAPQYVHADNAEKCIRTALGALRLAGRVLPDSPPEEVVISLRNGLMLWDDDTNSIKLAPHDKSYGIRAVVPCDYDPAAEAPLFQKFLTQVQPDKACRARLAEHAGYTLMPDTRFQVCQFWIGDGKNGKGVLAKVIQQLHSHVVSVDLKNLSGFGLEQLIDATLVYVDEVPTAGIDSDVLKSLLSGNDLHVNRKFKDPVMLSCRAKFLLCGNNIPVTSDHSNGYRRRFEYFPFPVVIKDEDTDYKLTTKIIRSELPGVLNWALDGLKRLLTRGAFGPQPATMQKLTETVRVETNSALAWATDFEVVLCAQVATPKQVIYDSYRLYCHEKGIKSPMSDTKFWVNLQKLFPLLNTEGRIRVKDKQVRTCNIDLSPPMNLQLFQEAA